jgi:hypothetical protein
MYKILQIDNDITKMKNNLVLLEKIADIYQNKELGLVTANEKKIITILDEFVESSTEKDVVFVASYLNELLSTNFKLEDYYEKN